MYKIESKNVITPQNGLNIYVGRTEDSITLTEVRDGDPMDIGIKTDAPQQLAMAIRTRRSPGVIMMGNLGDPYCEYEEEHRLTRECLKVIENYDHGVIISTRRSGIRRDIDILSSMARKTKCVIDIPFPTLYEKVIRKLDGEGTMTVDERIDLIRELRKNNIDVIVTVQPIIPFVNTEEQDILDMVQLLDGCDILGIDLMGMRTALPKATREFFFTEFEKRFPEEFRLYSEEKHKDTELVPAGHRKLLARVEEACQDYGIMCDTKRIRAWKRQYENKQVGVQMSLSDFI